jgi:hypothetical protein
MTLRRTLLVTGMALGASILSLCALPSCNTPFIPLPPPGDPTFTPVVVNDAAGTHMVWETRGTADPEAKVSIYNADVGAGVIVRALTDGTYVAAPIDGREGDRVQIEYLGRDGRAAPGICRILQKGPGRAQTPCP